MEDAESRPARGMRQGGLRVLHVDTGREWRGGQRQALLLVEALRERGHEGLCAFRTGAPLAAAAEAASLRVMTFAPRGEWDVHAALELRKQIPAARPDLIHAHDNHAVSVALLAARGRLPVVASRRVPFRSRRNPVSRVKLKSVTRWIAVSAAARDSLVQAGVDPCRVKVVLSGIRSNQPQYVPRSLAGPRAATPLRAELGLPPDSFLILTAGWLEPVKGQRTFIEACGFARDLQDVRWVLAGKGPDRLFLERLATVTGVGDRVVFAGQLENLPTRIHEVQICVLASYWEGLGTVLLDALAAGVPVVGTAAAGIPEVVADGGEGLLVPVGDARSVAEAIRRLYLDPALRRDMGERARRRALAFTIDATAEGTLAVYREALEEHHASRGRTIPAESPS